jgi:hypothetical protein
VGVLGVFACVNWRWGRGGAKYRRYLVVAILEMKFYLTTALRFLSREKMVVNQKDCHIY